MIYTIVISEAKSIEIMDMVLNIISSFSTCRNYKVEKGSNIARTCISVRAVVVSSISTFVVTSI